MSKNVSKNVSVWASGHKNVVPDNGTLVLRLDGVVTGPLTVEDLKSSKWREKAHESLDLYLDYTVIIVEEE